MITSGKLRIGTLLVAALLIFSTSPITFRYNPQNAAGEGSGDYPPPALGNWTVTHNTTIRNEDITVRGNITISENATLTLDNVALTINASGYGTALLWVQRGATLNIVNGSSISEGESQINYDFLYAPGSRGIIANSTIKNCGWNDGGTFQSSQGLLVMSDNVTIEYSTITKGYCGVVIYNSAPAIVNNVITDNLKQGINVMSGSPEISGNDISVTPVGLIVLEGNLILTNNIIMDCGDAAIFYYSNVTITGGNISSNSREDCATGSCSSSESGKGVYMEGSILKMYGVTVADNDDSGIRATTSDLNITDCVLTGNEGSGIVTMYSSGHITDSVIGGNHEYGVRMVSGMVDISDSNDFTDSNEMGRVRMERELSVFVTDSYGNRVSHASVNIQGNGTQFFTNTSYSGIAFETLPEYQVANSGALIQYNPYTLTASKVASWNDVEYTNSTTVSMVEDLDVDIMIPMVSPDLKVEALTLPDDVTVGRENKITVTIKNIGDAAANNFEVTVYETDSEGGKRIVERTTTSLAADQSKDLTVSWKPEIPGESTIEVTITAGYDELKTENNEIERTVDVGEMEPGLFENIYVYGFVAALLIIIAGLVFYSLLTRKKKQGT